MKYVSLDTLGPRPLICVIRVYRERECHPEPQVKDLLRRFFCLEEKCVINSPFANLADHESEIGTS